MSGQSAGSMCSSTVVAATVPVITDGTHGHHTETTTGIASCDGGGPNEINHSRTRLTTAHEPTSTAYTVHDTV